MIFRARWGRGLITSWRLGESAGGGLNDCGWEQVDRDLLRQAFDARRNAVDVSVLAHQLMVARGLESAEPPEGTQWTAVIGDALNEEFAAAEFPFRRRSGGPRQASA